MDNVTVFVAESLSAAVNEIAKNGDNDERMTANIVAGSSGTLRSRIEKGDKADVFISANLDHSRRLANIRCAGQENARVIPFARNQLCALTHTRLKVAATNLLDLMLDHRITLATSTPGEDPAGDDAWTLFHRAEILRPGSETKLSEKATQISGNAVGGGKPDYKQLLETGGVDIFLTYRTDILPLVKQHEGLDAVRLPDVLSVESDQSLIVLNDTSPAPWQFAMKLFSVAGRQMLAQHGFLRPSVPKIASVTETTARLPKPTGPMYIPATAPSKN
jgi:molybdate transport system substrate-binding protein